MLPLTYEQQWAVDLHNDFKSSLFLFAKHALNYPNINQYTHGKLIKILESPSHRKMILMPRGSLKSSLACVAYPIWILLNNPDARILIDSELYTNSSTFLREIRQHLQSPILTHLFGDFKSSTWNESEIIIKQRAKNYKEASITVGGVGTTKVGQHYSHIIGDDYCSPANQANKGQAEKVVDHYRMNTSILEPNGTYVVIGTRYSMYDLYQHILDNEINVKNDDNGLLKEHTL